MTYPRRLLVPPGRPGTYHCVSRCVRRTYLCGRDEHTGQSFEHRKGWVERRLLQLAKCFAIDVYGFAVMSNHFHLVVHIDPRVADAWSNREVARRWVAIWRPGESPEARRMAEKALLLDPSRLIALRSRLGSLSWFMRCLKEPIARRANREDECTGRFWEGRFKVQELLDESAILSALVYVDLNPFRAGVMADPLVGPSTSIPHRSVRRPTFGLRPLQGSVHSRLLGITESDYLGLVCATATLTSDSAYSNLRAPSMSVVTRLGFNSRTWRFQVLATESVYYRVIGRAESMRRRAVACGQRWFKGVIFATRIGQAAPDPGAA